MGTRRPNLFAGLHEQYVHFVKITNLNKFFIWYKILLLRQDIYFQSISSILNSNLSKDEIKESFIDKKPYLVPDAVEAENYFDHLEMEELVVYEGILRMR